MIDLAWEEKLRFLVDQDHQMRNVLLEKGILSDTYHPEMEKIHINNARTLQEMINKMGFPVLSNAGEAGVRLSWTIIHHAISLPDFMRECLMEMRLAAGQQDYLLELLAFTEDRVAYFEGRPQLYGTNYDWIDGELSLTPIEDPAKLDLRRKAMGLPPMKDMTISSMDRPPRDPERKAKEFQDWLVRVGWRNH